jgi:hypothetical protein
VKIRSLGLAVAVSVLTLALFPAMPRADAANPFNQGSPVATNLTAVEDFRAEYPFVDFIKQARPWFSGTTAQFQDGRTLALDADGHVLSLEPGQVARTVLFDGLPVDPDLIGRRFVVRFEGQGTLTYQLGAHLIGRSPGRDVIELTGNGPGESNILVIVLSAVEPANPLRRLRVVPEGGICASDPLRWVAAGGACAGGDFRSFEEHSGTILFNPEFLDRIKAYRGLRFMDWMRTNDSTQVHFEDRPMVAHQFWSTDAGVPLEPMIALANLMAMDPWFCIPHRATDDYVTAFATLVRDQLEASRTVYVEYSNEVWNGQFAQTGFVRDQGDALNLGMIDHDGDPGTPEVENVTIGMLRFYSRRARQIHQIFTTVFGGSSRLQRVMSTQAVVPFFSQTILEFEGAAALADRFAIAPYFGDTAASADQVAAYKSLGVDGIFEWLIGARTEPRLELNLPRVDQVVASQVEVVSRFSLPLITYEGGQHFVGALGFESDPELNVIFDAVNRDPRMHDVYTTYLTNWRGRSAETFWHFASADRWSRFGRWGALEFQTQPRSDAPKFDAIHDFIEAIVGLASFVDVPPTHAFSSWIEALVRAGITAGCGTNPPLYCPDQGVSRAQMAVFLLRGIHGAGYTPPAASGIFADVALSDALAPWIEQLFVEGITAGCGTNPPRYCPTQSVTRGEMAVFLLGATHGVGYQPPEATGVFVDVPLDHPFARFIEQLSTEAITGGCGTNPPRYCPDQPVTRGQMAVFLVRAFGLPL